MVLFICSVFVYYGFKLMYVTGIASGFCFLITVCVYFKYSIASTFIEMLPQIIFLFFFFSSSVFVLKLFCISSLDRGKTFR